MIELEPCVLYSMSTYKRVGGVWEECGRNVIADDDCEATVDASKDVIAHRTGLPSHV